MGKKWLGVVCLLAVAIPATAESTITPELVRRQDNRVHFADYVAYAGIATYHALDYQSTRQGLRMGLKEAVLPNALVHSPGAFAGYEAGLTALEVSSSVMLIHHGHRKLARTVNLISIGIGAAVVARNYSNMGVKR